MTDTPNATGMGPDVPATATRSTRRTRRLAIIGALAIVLIAGAVLVGARVTGSRSGASVGFVTCKVGGQTYFSSTSGVSYVQYDWYNSAGTLIFGSGAYGSGQFSRSTASGAARVRASWGSGAASLMTAGTSNCT